MTLTVIALASIAGVARVDARGEEPREGHEQRRSAAERQAGQREAQARPSRRPQPARPQAVHSAPRREAFYAHERPVVNDHRELVGRSVNERRLSDGGVAREPRLTRGGQVREGSPGRAAGQVRVVRYGHTLSGTVERTIQPGVTSRTFVSGGHVLYTHVYQHHVWRQFGRSFGYETFVPAVRYPAVYYTWALSPWRRAVIYSWDWQVQPWYPVYGSLFTPYPVYTSPDLWMTDYIIAQSMQTAYQAQTAAPPPEPLPQGASEALAPDSGVAAPSQQPSDVPPAPQSADIPSAPVAQPPVITPQVKAQLNTQIKVQLREQQAAAATPLTLTTQSGPAALRPNHVFFQVVQPLDVPSGTANGHCTLSANDYIKRTGGMSDEDWMIPVVVELSRTSDCPEGLQTRIGLNDLNAMENEQEAQVLEAMQAASRRMGPNGPPSGPGVHPTLIAAGNAAPDPGALSAIRQAQ